MRTSDATIPDPGFIAYERLIISNYFRLCSPINDTSGAVLPYAGYFTRQNNRLSSVFYMHKSRFRLYIARNLAHKGEDIMNFSAALRSLPAIWLQSVKVAFQ